MMDYYEELGVSRTASVEEIRQAYKLLVRLLHPDRCSDDPARRLAEIQTMRLNGILAVLANPEQRAHYDLGLLDGPPGRGIPWAPSTGAAPVWFWPAFGVALLVTLVFLLVPGKPKPVGALAPDQPVLAAFAKPNPKPTPARRSKRKTGKRPPRDESARPAEEPAAILAEAPAPPNTGPTAPQEERIQRSTAMRAPKAPASAPPAERLAGDWLFVQNSGSPAPGLYPAEYIEVRVAEASGTIQGRYRARYRVSDRAISPSVAFRFEGTGGANRAVLPWRGPAGAKGEITLQLLSADRLEVSWEASRIGAEMGLISGKAVLVRKLE